MMKTQLHLIIACLIGWLHLENGASIAGTGILRTKPNSMRTVLAADVGGTYTRMSLVEIGRPWRNLSIMRSHQKFTNSEFSCIDEIISMFLDKVPLEYSRPSSACFAVAGPCLNDVGTLTNGGNWIVNGDNIATKYGMNSVKVVNDFVACGYGLLTLNDEEDCVVIQVRSTHTAATKSICVEVDCCSRLNSTDLMILVGCGKDKNSSNSLYWRRHWVGTMLPGPCRYKHYSSLYFLYRSESIIILITIN